MTAPTNQRRVLVTGAAGFIGANLVRELLRCDYEVTVLDNLSGGRREHLAGLPLEFVEGDILSDQDLAKVVTGHGAVIHLAAQTGVPASLIDPRRDCEVNVLGTLNLLEACRATGRRTRFIFASSNAPLGRQRLPAREDKAPLPISPYGASKLAGEAYCLAYHGSWGLKTVVLRFANVYGPFSEYKESVVAKFIMDILWKGEITVDGDGSQTRDFLYVADLCGAVLSVLDSDIEGEVIQVASGVETSILGLSEMLKHIAGNAIELRKGPARLGDMEKNYSDISKARAMLDWRPKVDLETGLRETWSWFQLSLNEALGTREA